MLFMKILTLSALCAMVMAGAAASDPCTFKFSTSCPCGWTQFYDRCFLHVAKPMAWAVAQKHCQTMNANLASVHSSDEYQMIQSLIFIATNMNGRAWIGGSDAQQEGYWFWIDGTPFNYVN
ncbi:ladderlectin-like [Channa argus]|nr:hypothetical protein Q8A73_012710 [Channa argus]